MTSPIQKVVIFFMENHTTDDLSAAQLQVKPGDAAWSANEVLAHLRACADAWGSCIATVIAEDTPTLRAINPRTWMERTEYAQLDFETSLRSFATQRTDLLAIRRTVLFYAQWLASHERSHLKQFERVNAAVVTRPDIR